MAAISKTQGVSLITLQEATAAPRTIVGNAVDVATKLAATIFVRLGRIAEATYLYVPVEVRIEGSAKSSGDGFWFLICALGSEVGAAASEALTGTVAAGQAVLTMASTTGFAVGDKVFVRNSTLANSEFGRVVGLVANTSLTLEENLANAQTGSTVYNKASLIAPVTVDLTAVGRIRVVVSGASVAQNYSVEAWMVTGDSIG